VGGGVLTPSCPVCGTPARARKAWLFACGGCGLEFSNLAPGGGTGIAGLETLRKLNFERLLDRLERIRPLKGVRALEAGPADGWFLEAAKRRGADIRGIEPDRALAESARARGFDVETGFFPDDLKNPGPYELIVFNDVFEHLPDPAAMFRRTAGLLAPDGLVAINLPSSRGALYRLALLLDRLGVEAPLARLWQKGLPSPHLSTFHPENLRRLAGAAGLEPVDAFALRTITREGLSERIASTHRGPAGAILFAGVWLMSFVYVPPLALSDIFVGVFRKPALR
jgi:SAM-dependent methyltransferase